MEWALETSNFNSLQLLNAELFSLHLPYPRPLSPSRGLKPPTLVNKTSLLLCSLVAALAGCNAPSTDSATEATSKSAAPQDSKPLNIAVIPKGTTHSYWKSVEKGAREAAAETGANITYKGRTAVLK
jgi:hypothetical protein